MESPWNRISTSNPVTYLSAHLPSLDGTLRSDCLLLTEYQAALGRKVWPSPTLCSIKCLLHAVFFRTLQSCLLTDDFVSNLIKKLENGSLEWPPISLLVPINLSVTPVTVAWFSPGVSHLLGLLVDLALLVNCCFPCLHFLCPAMTYSLA